MANEEDLTTAKTTTLFLANESMKPSSLSFPTEFPYEFDLLCSSSSALASPAAESTTTTTMTDGDVSSGGEEQEQEEVEEEEVVDFFTGLTRRLTQQLALNPENRRVMAGSPESTLGGLASWSVSSNGSPNGVLSPPMTPFGAQDDPSWDPIPTAAVELNRLTMCSSIEGDNKNSMDFKNFNAQHHAEKGLLCPGWSQQNRVGFYFPQDLAHDGPQIALYRHRMMQESELKPQFTNVWSRQQQTMPLAWQVHPQEMQGKARLSPGYETPKSIHISGLPESSWAPHLRRLNPQHCLHHQHQLPSQLSAGAMRAALLGRSGIKKQCAGTGVFLPRSYGNAHENKKKLACSTVLLPAKVVQALNLNLNDLSMSNHAPSRFNTAFASDYDILMARRNLILSQQRRNMQPETLCNHELRLPQEWTY